MNREYDRHSSSSGLVVDMKTTTRKITYLVNRYCGRDERIGRSQEQSGHRSGKLHCSSRLSMILLIPINNKLMDRRAAQPLFIVLPVRKLFVIDVNLT
jgi:hypothetical protein